MSAPVPLPMDPRVREWRDAFDAAFAEPARRAPDNLRDFLGLQLAGQPMALDLSRLAGLQAAAMPTPYPAAAPGLLGLVGHQGRVLPLYDLQALAGHGAAPVLRWMVIVKDQPLALGFEQYDGQWRLPPQDLLTENGRLRALRIDGQPRPLIDLDTLVADLRARHPE